MRLYICWLPAVNAMAPLMETRINMEDNWGIFMTHMRFYIRIVLRLLSESLDPCPWGLPEILTTVRKTDLGFLIVLGEGPCPTMVEAGKLEHYNPPATS